MSSSAGPAARLCRLERGPDGYGFHLHGEKGKPGQFIRLVEAGSPAERSGLRAGDRLLEVDGENVERESHQQVVERIRAAAGAVSLLVVDSVPDEQLQKRNGTSSESPVSCVQAAPEPADPAVREPSSGGQRVNKRVSRRTGLRRWEVSAAGGVLREGVGVGTSWDRAAVVAFQPGEEERLPWPLRLGHSVCFPSRYFLFRFTLNGAPELLRALPPHAALSL